MAQAKRLNLDEWYTADKALERLKANSGGRDINQDYPRTLARYGKIKTFDIGTRTKLYWKADIDGYVVDTKRGRKAATKGENQ
jgi:hypothetical protein